MGSANVPLTRPNTGEASRVSGSCNSRAISPDEIRVSLLHGSSGDGIELTHRRQSRGPFGGEVVGRLHRQRGRSGRGCRRSCRRHRVESASWGEGECEERRSAIVETALGRFVATLLVARSYLALCTPFLPGVDARRPAGFPFDDGLGLLRREPEGVGPRALTLTSVQFPSRMSASASLVSAMASRASAILSRQSATKSRFAADQPLSSSDRLLDTASGPFWTSSTGRRTNDRLRTAATRAAHGCRDVRLNRRPECPGSPQGAVGTGRLTLPGPTAAGPIPSGRFPAAPTGVSGNQKS